MNVIKHGKEYDATKYHECTCGTCECVFEYSEDDILSYLNEEEYVVCPECHQNNNLETVNHETEGDEIFDDLLERVKQMNREYREYYGIKTEDEQRFKLINDSTGEWILDKESGCEYSTSVGGSLFYQDTGMTMHFVLIELRQNNVQNDLKQFLKEYASAPYIPADKFIHIPEK